MLDGKITTNNTKNKIRTAITTTNIVCGTITVKDKTHGAITTYAPYDHNQLYNRETSDQHPIGAITGLQEALDTESTNLEEAKEEFNNLLAHEADLRHAADQTLASNLTSEKAALEAAMNKANTALQTAIDEVQTNLDNAVAELQVAINANETDIEAKVLALDTAYKTADTLLRSEFMAADEELSDKITALETAMNTAHSALQSAIDTVQSNLDNAVEELQSTINTNEADIENKVSALDSAYKAADTLLRSDMATADEELNGKITALETAVNTSRIAIENIANTVSNETSARKNADDSLQSQITTNANAIELLTNGVKAEEIDSVNDLIQYVKDHGAEVIGINNAIKANAKAITDQATINALTYETKTDAANKFKTIADVALSASYDEEDDTLILTTVSSQLPIS